MAFPVFLCSANCGGGGRGEASLWCRRIILKKVKEGFLEKVSCNSSLIVIDRVVGI